MAKAEQDGVFDGMEHYVKIGRRLKVDLALSDFFAKASLAGPKEYVANRLRLLKQEFDELLKCMKDAEVDPPPL